MLIVKKIILLNFHDAGYNMQFYKAQYITKLLNFIFHISLAYVTYVCIRQFSFR